MGERVERDTVWLVGMMGVGKSTVGPLLAARLERDFLDADTEIERREGRSIPEIFEERGEPGFREAERKAIEALAGRPLVVALGGGAICQPGAPERLAESGTVVYLRASAETLVARIGDDGGRPLLAGLGPTERLERVKALLAERGPCYETAALAVDADDGAPHEVAHAIAQQLEAGP